MKPEAFSSLAAIAFSLTWAVDSPNAFLMTHPAWVVGFLIVGMIAASFTVRSVRGAEWFTLCFVVAVGVANRFFRDFVPVSDVIDATSEALGVLTTGHNPYLHTFLSTRPIASPFPYLPGELLFYGIPYVFFHTIQGIDKAAGIAIIFLIASLAPVTGAGRAALCVALYALFEQSAFSAIKGSNDTGLAFLLIVAVTFFAWGEVFKKEACFYAGSVFLAWALLFKLLAWPFFPFLASYLLRRDPARAPRYVLTTCAAFVVGVLPALIASPGAFVMNVYHAFTLHDFFGGFTVWTALYYVGIVVDPHAPIVPLAAVSITAGLFCLLMRGRIASLGDAMSRGLVVVLTGVVLARWASADYFAFAGTICAFALVMMTALRDTDAAMCPESASARPPAT